MKDPLTEKAEEVAEAALSNRPMSGYTTMDKAERYVRDQVKKFASTRVQREFIEALRVAMLQSMERHRVKCPHNPCGREDHYVKLKFVLFDELAARTPEGTYTADLSYSVIKHLEQVKRELLDAINDGHERTLEADTVLLGCIEEGFDELLKDRGMTTSNTSSMLRKYLEKIGERVANKAVIDPFVEEILKTLS